MTNTRHPEQFHVAAVFGNVGGPLISETSETVSGFDGLSVTLEALFKVDYIRLERVDVERLRDGKIVLRYDVDGFDL